MRKKDIHKYTHPNMRRKEFLEHRTSWKWFENRFQKHHDIADRLHMPVALQTLLLIEILKEAQFANDQPST